MRIRGWSIESFGALGDHAVEDLPDGLVVFHRPNEAGKTTLLAFLRGMLFGFSRSGNGHANGGAAGRLSLVANDAEYAIERRAGQASSLRVRCPGEREGGASDLDGLLGGIDDRLFRSVFAFGLGELQDFGTLDGEALRERIFSASIAGAGHSARRAIEDLTHGAASRFAAQARIDGLIVALNQLRPRRDAALASSLAYGEAAAAERRLTARIAELRRRRAELETSRRRAELLIGLWPPWSELAASRASLDGLEAATPVPEGLAASLRRANERIAAARGTLAALEREQEESARRRANAGPHPIVTPERCEELHRDLAPQRARLERLPVARARRGALAAALDERLSAFGPAWDVERLMSCDTSRAARVALRDLETARRDAASEECRLSGAFADAARCRDGLREESGRIAAAMGDPDADAASIAAERKALGRIVEKLAEVAAEQALGEAADRTAQDRDNAMRSAGIEAPAAPPAWLPPLFWAVASIAVAAMPWRAARADLIGAVAFALSGCVAAFGAWGASRLRQARSEAERRREREQRAVRGELFEARRVRDVHWRRAAECLEAATREAARLGFARAPRREDIEQRERELLRREAEVSGRLALCARFEETNAALRRVGSEMALLEAELERARETDASRRREWLGWKAARALREDLTLEQAEATLDAIREAQSLGNELGSVEEELREIERAIEAWEASARALLGRDAETVDETGSELLLERVLDRRRRDLEREVSLLAERKIESEMGERERRVAEAAAELGRARAERAALLSAAGVADEAELERRRELAVLRASVEQAIAERQAAIDRRLAAEPNAGEIRATLSIEEPAAWSRRLQEVAAELDEIDRCLLDALAEQRDTARRCRESEESAEIGRIELEWRGLTAEIVAAVRRWRVLALAEGLVEDTLEEMRESSRPRVLVEASRHFSLVTAGRYQGIEQDEDGRELVLLEAGGRRKRVPEELSRGTAEQLYLCLRLGLVADFARHGAALPVVMDDVLVNFDPDRARAMAGVLGDFARGHQVLFFTCHPNVCAMLAEAGNASAVIRL